MRNNEFKQYPNTPLCAPKRDWRDMPSLQAVVLDHFKTKRNALETVEQLA